MNILNIEMPMITALNGPVKFNATKIPLDAAIAHSSKRCRFRRF